MSARAMGAAMVQLKPYFASGAIQAKGTFIIGTVKGDLHVIGKNLVAMMSQIYFNNSCYTFLIEIIQKFGKIVMIAVKTTFR